MSRLKTLIFCALLAPTLAACGGSDDPQGDGDPLSDGGPTTDGTTIADTYVAPKMTPSPSCDRYLACLAAATPTAFPVALQVYKEDGPCWATAATASNCEKACDAGYEQLEETYLGVEECGGCSTTDCFLPLQSDRYGCQRIVQGNEADCMTSNNDGFFGVTVKTEDDGDGIVRFEFGNYSIDATRDGNSFSGNWSSEEFSPTVDISVSGRLTAPHVFDLTISAAVTGYPTCIQTYHCK